MCSHVYSHVCAHVCSHVCYRVCAHLCARRSKGFGVFSKVAGLLVRAERQCLFRSYSHSSLF